MLNPIRLAILGFAFPGAMSALDFAPAFSDHMVLQAGRPLWISGHAAPGRPVTITLAETSRTATADATGNWGIDWPALPPTRTDLGAMLVATSEGASCQISDVLIGEVWLCSGQSNMRFALGRHEVRPDLNTPQLFPTELAAAHHPRIRLLNVSGGTPAQRRWGICDPSSAAEFSAVGYFFGQALAPLLDGEPVGLIDLGKGAEPIRGFISRQTIAANPVLRGSIAQLPPSRLDPSGEVFEQDLRWLAPFAVRGVLWYQGESDGGHAQDYAAWLAALIGEWRTTLGSPTAAFLVVQLPVFQGNRTDPPPKRPGTHWAELRAAQLQVADTLPGVSIAPALDLGEPFEVHPHRKPLLGLRLARIAAEHVYGQPVPADAPRVSSATRNGKTCILRFAQAEGGIVASGPRLANFECGGADGSFVPVEAQVSGFDTVQVTIPTGFDARTVRYGWRDYFAPDLFNGESLPVLPFSVKIPPRPAG